MEMLFENQEDGARKGAEFIKKHIIKVTDKPFDDFVTVETNTQLNRINLGI